MKQIVLFIALLLGISSQAAHACPRVVGLIDPNCDGAIRFMLTGDSIVRGVGDKFGLGYPGYLEAFYNDVQQFQALNIGVPGSTPNQLRRAFIRNIDRGRKTTRFTQDIDYGLIQIGTNNYWSGEEPFQVVAQIVRLKKYLEKALTERNGHTPLLFTATVPLSLRSYQNPFLQGLNTELLRNKNRLNVLVRFDTIPVERLAIQDTLHPSTRGYKVMAKEARKGLLRAQQQAEQLFPTE